MAGTYSSIAESYIHRGGHGENVGKGLKVEVLVAQTYPTLCDPMNYSSPPGSSVHGIFQTKILEWIAFSFSKGASIRQLTFYQEGNKSLKFSNSDRNNVK